jgi:hypothetical protein
MSEKTAKKSKKIKEKSINKGKGLKAENKIVKNLVLQLYNEINKEILDKIYKKSS